MTYYDIIENHGHCQSQVSIIIRTGIHTAAAESLFSGWFPGPGDLDSMFVDTP